MGQKKILLIAFHFPPFSGSSGVQRTLRFCQYLPKNGWLPVVLSANQKAYEKYSDELLSEIPRDVEVKRAFALDTARHLSIRGRYSRLLAIPDRWVSWALGAIPSGYLLAKKHQPKLIWSTYPLATTHLIAYVLHKLTKLPWVADFRDPMVERRSTDGQWIPQNTLIRKARLYIENNAIKNASRIVFCTEGARNICKERYPAADHSKMLVIPNGFDEKTFKAIEGEISSEKKENKPVVLLHSGFLYNSPDRNPSHFFEALSQLKKEGIISRETLRVKLRACGHDKEYQRISEQKNISDIISFEPSIQYNEAIKEMMTTDGLLIFQGYTSNPAIPAKLYEYIRAKKPIFSLADREGDTAKFLEKLGMNDIAPLDDASTIKEQLIIFLKKIKDGSVIAVPDEIIMRYSRESQAGDLASVFNDVTSKENAHIN
ncbi:MAG TPA: glycosyltransferase [Gammaproteobacteria bacterium]|nr:glycosyltransferase [Gammaproteobacteria bacterium]